MSGNEQKTFEQGASEIAQLRHDSELLQAQLEAKAAAKVQAAASLTSVTAEKNQLKRKADQTNADLEAKRTKREELEGKLADAIATENAASASNATADASLKEKQDAEKAQQASITNIDDELVAINDDTARLKRDEFSVKQDMKEGLSSQLEDFSRWTAELYVRENGALLFPLPMEYTKTKFKGTTGNLPRALDFLAYLANLEYFHNRVLVIANQCANDHQAAKSNGVKDASRKAILCAIEKSDSDRLSAVAHQGQLIHRLHQLFTAEVDAEIQRIKATIPTPAGNHSDGNLAKTTIMTIWATEHLFERTEAT